MSAFSIPAIPIIQAPMAGGITTPELVCAVAEAGAVGSFGFAYSTAEKIASDMAQVRAVTTGAINANFFVIEVPPFPEDEVISAAISALSELPLLPPQPYQVPVAPFVPDLAEQLAPIWECPPDYLTFHFGIPEQAIMARARQVGIMVGISATCISEAKAIEKAGADFIIAQGYEAGGHRGTFAADAPKDETLSTFALTKLLAGATNLPVVSAGGLMNASDITRALEAGANAVQMGTAFLCADEAGTPASYQAALTADTKQPTIMTRAFSGRNARSLYNDFIGQMDGKSYLPFPFQNILTASLRKAASNADNAHYQSLWAGTGYAAIKSAPAADIIAELAAGLKNITRLSGRVPEWLL